MHVVRPHLAPSICIKLSCTVVVAGLDPLPQCNLTPFILADICLLNFWLPGNNYQAVALLYMYTEEERRKAWRL